jgi:hypothetical protein
MKQFEEESKDVKAKLDEEYKGIVNAKEDLQGLERGQSNRLTEIIGLKKRFAAKEAELRRRDTFILLKSERPLRGWTMSTLRNSKLLGCMDSPRMILRSEGCSSRVRRPRKNWWSTRI